MPRRKNPIPKPTLVRDKAGYWQISWTDPHKGYTRKKSTGEKDRAAAEKVLQVHAGEIVSTGPKNSDAYTIGELLTAFEASKDGDIAQSDINALKRLHEFFDAFTPDKLNDAVWKRYRKRRMEHDQNNAASKHFKTPRKVSDATACRELNVMRAAISWAKRDIRWRNLGHVRVVLPDVQRNPRQEFLTKDEARKLVDACETHHTQLFTLLALATGARHRAILGLKWSDVKWPGGSEPNLRADLDMAKVFKVVPKGMPLLPENARAEGEEGFPGYNGGTRMLVSNPRLSGPIHLDLGVNVGNKRKPLAIVSPSNGRLYRALFEAYRRRSCDYVIEWRGAGIDRVDLSDAYRRAGLNKPRAPQHILKHTAISWLIQEGREVAKIAALTQTSVQTIERTYGHLLPQHLETVGDVLTID